MAPIKPLPNKGIGMMAGVKGMGMGASQRRAHGVNLHALVSALAPGHADAVVKVLVRKNTDLLPLINDEVLLKEKVVEALGELKS